MKTFIISILFAAFFVSCSQDVPPMPGDNDIVYVCTGNSAKTYHTYRDCASMKSCKEEVLEVTRRKARENERIICMNCKKREDDQKQKNDEQKQKDSAK